MNFTASSRSSTFFPSLQSTVQKHGEKNEFIYEQIIETLPQLVDELHIDRNTKYNNSKVLNQSTTRKKSANSVQKTFVKKTTIPSYDIDNMSSQELQESLFRVKDNTKQPFSFLTDIFKEYIEKDSLPVQGKNLTEIDIQLAAVAKCIESSKILLREFKSYANDIDFRIKSHEAKNEQINREI